MTAKDAMVAVSTEESSDESRLVVVVDNWLDFLSPFADT